MNDFINKLEFKQISKECKDTFLQLLEQENIIILRKQITPVYKSFFQGKVYFNSFVDFGKAKKLLIEAKETEQEAYKIYLQTERAKLIQQN